MVELRRHGGGASFGPDKNSNTQPRRPSVVARVAAAALRLQQAGELDAAQALLMLVAGDAAAPRRLQQLVGGALDKKSKRIRERRRVNASPPRHAAHYARRDDEAVIGSKRKIRAILPPQEVKMAAIKSFAAGEITADELRRVLWTYA
jgi:hypothetical protein